MKMSHVPWNVCDRFTKVCPSLTELDQWLYSACHLILYSTDAHTTASLVYMHVQQLHAACSERIPESSRAGASKVIGSRRLLQNSMWSV
jgi:hypothetical protein